MSLFFSLNAFSVLYPGLRHVDLSEVDLTCRTSMPSDFHGEEGIEWEPYTTEKMTRLSGGYKLLTDVTEALEIDFNNPKVSVRILTNHTEHLGETSSDLARLLTKFDLSVFFGFAASLC